MAANLPKMEEVTKLSTSVIRIMGGNPNKFTLQGSNTYILGTGPTRLLLDTAVGLDTWKSLVHQVLSDETVFVSTCLLSHWHYDHIGGAQDFHSSSPETPIFKAFGKDIDPQDLLENIDVKDIKDGDKFTDDNGFEVEAVHCPGHTEDHMAFLITKSTDPSEVGAMFTGDNVLGHGTAVFEDLATYIESLHLMRSRVRQQLEDCSGEKARAYPGHGMVVEDVIAKIGEYIDHRKMREDEAMNVLRYGSAKKPADTTTTTPSPGAGKEWGSMEMVKVIYRDVPEHLHVPAEKGLLMVLAKLKGEGQVVERGKKWKVANERATL